MNSTAGLARVPSSRFAPPKKSSPKSVDASLSSTTAQTFSSASHLLATAAAAAAAYPQRRQDRDLDDDYSAMSEGVDTNDHGGGGLPLRSLPAKVLSSPTANRRRALERAEYLEVTRRRVVPKLVELAGRLVPAAAAELGGGGSWAGRRAEEGNGESEMKGMVVPAGNEDNDRGKGGYKTTGLDDAGGERTLDDMEGGRGGHIHHSDGFTQLPVSPLSSPFPTRGSRNRYGDDVDEDGGRRRDRLYLPQSAALLAAGVQPPSLTEKSDSPPAGHGEVVAVETIAASLDSSVVLLDYEADALLHSLREQDRASHRATDGSSGGTPEATTKGTGKAASLFRNRARTGSTDTSGGIESVASHDLSDDGMGGEIRRLGMVVDSLRRDLAGIDFCQAQAVGGEGDLALRGLSSSPDDANVAIVDDGGSEGRGGRRSIRRGHSSGVLVGSRGRPDFTRTARLATQLQTYKYFGLRGSDGSTTSSGSAAALYWAVALIWAVIILLAGHIKLRGAFNDGEGGEPANWEDVLRWLFPGGGAP